MREYAYDVKMFAVARVMAESDEEAREALRDQTFDINKEFDNVYITEASTDGEPNFFEVNEVP